MILKSQIELLLPVYFIVQNLIFNLVIHRTLILIIIYINFLRIKFLLSENLKIAASNINNSII